LDAKDVATRLNASGALGAIGQDAKEAVPRLLEAVKDKEWTVRRNAIGDLVRIAPDHVEIHKAVIAALKDENEKVRADAETAVEMIHKATGVMITEKADKPAAKAAGRSATTKTTP
jgi:HEAT repeat protein